LYGIAVFLSLLAGTATVSMWELSVRKGSAAKVQPPTPPTFAAAIEYALTRPVFTSSQKRITPFWVMHRSFDGCVPYPSQYAFYLRISNVTDEAKLITSYYLSSRGESITRLPVASGIGTPFWIVNKQNLSPYLKHQGTIQFQQSNGFTNGPFLDIDKADLSHAFQIDLDLLDRVVLNPIGPHQTIRGWVFLEHKSPTNPMMIVDVDMNIRTAQDEKLFSHPIDWKNGNPNADSSMRTVTLRGTVNLSKCKIAPEFHPGDSF
jgi:hypothetical protein